MGRVTGGLGARFGCGNKPERACGAWLRAQICEEAPVQMESEVPMQGSAGQVGSERVSAVLVPRLLALFGSPYEDAKCLAVSIMNLLAGGAPSALADHMDKCAPSPTLAGCAHAGACSPARCLIWRPAPQERDLSKVCPAGVVGVLMAPAG